MGDLINASFELISGLLVWMNVRQVYKDKGYAGVWVPANVFFLLWGLWNLYYYPSLGQWFSFYGGLSIVAANSVWIGLMMYFGKKQ